MLPWIRVDRRQSSSL